MDRRGLFSYYSFKKSTSSNYFFFFLFLSYLVFWSCVPMVSIVKNSLLRTPLRAVWEVAGYQTETLLWPATTQKKTILLFIPGNPGLVEYYTSFLQDIHEAVASPSFEIIGGTYYLLYLL